MYGKCMGKLGVIVGPIHEVEEVNGHLGIHRKLYIRGIGSEWAPKGVIGETVKVIV